MVHRFISAYLLVRYAQTSQSGLKCILKREITVLLLWYWVWFCGKFMSHSSLLTIKLLIALQLWPLLSEIKGKTSVIPCHFTIVCFKHRVKILHLHYALRITHRAAGLPLLCVGSVDQVCWSHLYCSTRRRSVPWGFGSVCTVLQTFGYQTRRWGRGEGEVRGRWGGGEGRWGGERGLKDYFVMHSPPSAWICLCNVKFCSAFHCVWNAMIAKV